MMIPLILIADETALRNEIVEHFYACGYTMNSVGSLAEFSAGFASATHAVVIADLGQQREPGFEFIRKLRAQGEQLGIIVISDLAGSAQKVAGLIAGADHYVAKPLDLGELSAIVCALSRRIAAAGVSPCWTLNATRRRLIPPGKAPIDLTAQAYTVLQAIASGDRRPVHRRKIVEALGGNYLHYDQRRIDTQMYELRKTVLNAAGVELPVRAARGQGYQFTAEIEVRA